MFLALHFVLFDISRLKDTDMSEEKLPCSRSVYMLTYSQADMVAVPSSVYFKEIVIDAFKQNGKANIVRWVCGQEKHKEGGSHYHMVVKLDRQKRWLSVRNYLDTKHSIKVNFSDKHANYYEAWKYVTKEDSCYIQNIGHPDFENATIPRTSAATSARRTKSENVEKQCTKRRKTFDALDLSEIILRHKIHSKAELLLLAKQQKSEGKTDLALYALNNIDKVVKVIQTTWDMEEAGDIVHRRKTPRLEILKAMQSFPCVEGCEGQWLTCAKETLHRNNIELPAFANAMITALEKGRGKNRNVLIIGPANCGKTFMLKPLSDIYNAFSNPSTNSFAWVGMEESEIIFLNDFRWTEKLISWQDLLKLLEGDIVHIAAPKTHFAKDLVMDKDTPIFATSVSRVRSYSNGRINEAETEMMEVRWKIFTFYSQIQQQEIKELQPCPKCFTDLVLG